MIQLPSTANLVCGHGQRWDKQSSGSAGAQPGDPLAGGLVEALTSTDNSQMQSRLQPYQAWAQRFGEVLAQKLSLAVKDGNWSVGST